jgi:hypothetical protein
MQLNSVTVTCVSPIPLLKHQCNVFRYIMRLITSLRQECSDYLLSLAYTITLYNHHFTIIPLVLSTNLFDCLWPLALSSTGVNARLLSSEVTSRLSDIFAVVATQWTFCYDRGYFLGNSLRRFHRSVSYNCYAVITVTVVR